MELSNSKDAGDKSGDQRQEVNKGPNAARTHDAQWNPTNCFPTGKKTLMKQVGVCLILEHLVGLGWAPELPRLTLY